METKTGSSSRKHLFNKTNHHETLRRTSVWSRACVCVWVCPLDVTFTGVAASRSVSSSRFFPQTLIPLNVPLLLISLLIHHLLRTHLFLPSTSFSVPISCLPLTLLCISTPPHYPRPSPPPQYSFSLPSTSFSVPIIPLLLISNQHSISSHLPFSFTFSVHTFPSHPPPSLYLSLLHFSDRRDSEG